MSEETYELRLEPEGFQIIPVGPDQLAVHSVDAVNGGDQIVTILPESLVHGDHHQDRNHKNIQPTLFLSAEDSHNLVASGVQFIENHKIEAEEPHENENLVIQYGETWFQDFLLNLQGIGNSLMDFPIFCCDGIFWSNRLILASLEIFLTDFLLEDSCIILPDFLKSEFRTFHDYLFSKENLSQSDMMDVCKIGSVFGFQFFTGLQYEYECPKSEVNYQEIFKNQQEEYFKKVYGHAELANHVMRVADKPKRPKVSMFLNEFLFNDKEKDQIVTCEECGRKFEDQELFKSHTETVHRKLEKPLLKPFPCKFCPKTFSYLLNVRRHTFLVHPNAKEKPEELITYNFETSNGDDDESQEFDRSNFIQHKPDFPELEKFKCKICGEFLKSKRYLVAHIQSHYGGGYKCDYPGCTSVFRENAKLNRHKLVHTGVKAFKCDFCHQTFSLRHNLKMHEKTHTRTDLQKCRFCSYETIQKSNMRLHEATHAKGPGKVKGRPAGRQNKGISKMVDSQEKMEVGDSNHNKDEKQEINEETPDEIEQFIAEMEKDQAI